MSILRRVRNGAAVAIVAAALGVAFTATPASATAINCTYGSNGSTIGATCDNTSPTAGWYLRLECIRYGNSRIYYSNGQLIYGPGTSHANCGTVGEPLDDLIVNL